MLASGALTLGPYTRGFEAAFAAAHTGPRAPSPDGPHAVAVASGTAALTIALLALGVRGREVVVPANTFYATAAAVLQAGARPVFADVDADTFALNASHHRGGPDPAHGGRRGRPHRRADPAPDR